MRRAILFYLAGVATALLWFAPAAPGALKLLVAAALILAIKPRTRNLAWFTVGLFWAAWHVAQFLAERPSFEPTGEVTLVQGQVVSFPRLADGRLSFQIEPELSARPNRMPRPRPRITVLAINSAVRPALGGWCTLYARVRAPRSLANFASGDQQRRFAAARLIGRAFVIDHPANVCSAIAPSHSPPAIRRRISQAITEAVVSPSTAAVIRALAVADRSALERQQWTRMRETGTSHLLAISGLHISLCAAWVFAIIRVLAGAAGSRRQHYAAHRAAWIAAAAAGLAYASLAGFAIPTQRASCVLLLAAVSALSGRAKLSFDHLLVALALLTAWDPFALLAEGLWLSFLAVGLLLAIAASNETKGHWLSGSLRVHAMLTLGLCPIIGLLYGEVSLSAPLANLIAVPWCSLLVVPLVLLGLLLHGWAAAGAAICWASAAELWAWLDQLLGLLQALSSPLSTVAWLNPTSVWLVVAGLSLLVLPRAFGLKRVAALLLLVAWLARPATPADKAFYVRVFDVGQGLAVLVRSRSHALLYDVGPARFGDGPTVARAIILPTLKRQRLKRLDAVIVSHGDADHAGGLDDILAGIEVNQVLVAPDGSFGDTFQTCRGDHQWRWDGVEFLLLHPAGEVSGSRNDRSCVLRISSPYGRIVLSGDIEMAAERQLLERRAGALSAEVLLVPHHGSRTSSTRAFIDAVSPRIGIISAGYGNRYGQPHRQVVGAYTDAGVALLNTATDGAIELRFEPEGLKLDRARDRGVGFWSRAGCGVDCAD